MLNKHQAITWTSDDTFNLQIQLLLGCYELSIISQNLDCKLHYTDISWMSLFPKSLNWMVCSIFCSDWQQNMPWICYEMKFQWILPLYMKPISFQSKASLVCSVTAAIFIDFCLKKLNVFSQHIGKKTNEYLNSAEQIPRNWNVDQLSVLIISWDIT